jgi:hypothetical protein
LSPILRRVWWKWRSCLNSLGFYLFTKRNSETPTDGTAHGSLLHQFTLRDALGDFAFARGAGSAFWLLNCLAARVALRLHV